MLQVFLSALRRGASKNKTTGGRKLLPPVLLLASAAGVVRRGGICYNKLLKLQIRSALKSGKGRYRL